MSRAASPLIRPNVAAATVTAAAAATVAAEGAERQYPFIVPYSDKSFAVFGDTKSIKDALMATKGRFNPSLTLNGQKTAGYIFGLAQQPSVEALLQTPETIVQWEANVTTTYAPRAKPTSPYAGAGASRPVALSVSQAPTRYERGGIAYQQVVYNIPLPVVGKTVTVVFDDSGDLPCVIVSLDGNTDIIDSFMADSEQGRHRFQITRGKWTCDGLEHRHSVEFSA